jgi:hypothetical protein
MSATKLRSHERNPGIFPADRACRNCGAKPLSRNNPSDICAPCNRGEWEEPKATDLHPVQVARIGTERDLESLAA